MKKPKRAKSPRKVSGRKRPSRRLRTRKASLRPDEVRTARAGADLHPDQALAAVVAASPMAIFALDPEGRIFLCWNKAAQRILGWRAEEVMGQPCPGIPPALQAEAKELERRGLSGASVGLETRRLRKDGTAIDVSLSAAPLRDARHRIYGLMVLLGDVSDRRRQESEIRRLASFPENNPYPVIELDRNRKVLYMNPAARRDFPDLAEKGADHPILAPLENLRPREATDPSAVQVAEVRLGDADYRIKVFVPPQTDHIRIFVQNVTEQKRAEESLRRHQERLRSLATQLVMSEERERRRIAVFLHDQIGQTLAMARIKLQSAEAKPQASARNEELDAVRRLIEDLIRDTRTATFNLAPPVLYELGFQAAVDWLVEEVRKQHNLRMTLEDEAGCLELADETRVFLFLALRETLVNVVKHAEARSVKVRLRTEDDTLRVEVTDDGKGFDVKDHGWRTGGGSGFGLFNIHDRLDQLGGRLEIQSKPGRGTTVILTAPLKNRNARKEA